MSEFIVAGFDNMFEADRVLTVLLRLEREYLIDLEDAVVAVRRPDGTVHLKQTISPAAIGAASGAAQGAMWGTVVGLFFLSPLLGLTLGGLAGAGIGAAAGSTIDYGIDDELVSEIADTLQPDNSALFLLVRKARAEKVLAELAPFNGRIIRSSLSAEQEEQLRKALGKPATPAAAA